MGWGGVGWGGGGGGGLHLCRMQIYCKDLPAGNIRLECWHSGAYSPNWPQFMWVEWGGGGEGRWGGQLADS